MGFTLFEVMIAVLLLAMVSSMIYSILNVSIRFSEKGEKSILLLERERGLLALLQRQISSGWYDRQKKEVVISAEESVLRVVTRAPLHYPQAGLVLAVYRYDAGSSTLYYQEKRDFYNIDYHSDYVPDFEEMTVLAENCPALSFSYEGNSNSVTVVYDGKEFDFTPWCQVETREIRHDGV
ncbi:MAG: prepilin-type N-terminal cleavage/methylation domain-containing protein [Deltaproteobacteria bacterium]|nr:prepilin-type N-terminal cleavage/methylation domain-containing protein [Deltaproteobacteria bacterium]